MDGFSFVKLLRKGNLQTPALFLMAKSRTGNIIQEFESGRNNYLKKPFSLEEFMVRVKELLRRSVPETVQELEKVTSLGKHTFMP